MGCAIWAQASQIGASQVKAPTGRVYEKYMYTCFMVKMRINLRSFGLFWFNLGWDSIPGRIWGTLNFGVLWVKKFKYRSAENMGYGYRKGSVSEKVQIFGGRSILMKYSLLYGSLSSSI